MGGGLPWWVGLLNSTAEGESLISGWGTKIPHIVCGVAKINKIKTNQEMWHWRSKDCWYIQSVAVLKVCTNSYCHSPAPGTRLNCLFFHTRLAQTWWELCLSENFGQSSWWKKRCLGFCLFLLTYSCRLTLYVTGVRCSHSQFLEVILHL